MKGQVASIKWHSGRLQGSGGELGRDLGPLSLGFLVLVASIPGSGLISPEPGGRPPLLPIINDLEWLFSRRSLYCRGLNTFQCSGAIFLIHL